MGVNPGRLGAARALIQIEDGAFATDALDQELPRGNDRDLGWFLTFGVLRQRAQVDASLQAHLRQPLASLDPAVRACLRLGAYEKLFARTADHAAVHQWVEGAKRLKAGRASGLINAVLRRVQALDWTVEQRMNHPTWLYERWVNRYGDAAAQDWCQRNNEPATLTICGVDDTDGQALMQGEWGAEPARAAGRTIPTAWTLDKAPADLTTLPGWERGRLWVQDAAAAAVADLCHAAPGRSILDACAAPGGKTQRLAHQGASVFAVDRSGRRLKRLEKNLTRTGVPIRVRRWDWTKGPCPDIGTFETVLVDAPCTGLGTVRRHPEIRWRRHRVDLIGAAAQQRAILEACAEHVKEGGSLVYAVCSPEPEEGLHVAEAFCRDRDWAIVESLDTAPPTDGEDGHQAFRMEPRP